MNKDDVFIYKDENGAQILIYLGRREIKDVVFDFFKEECGGCVFFYPSEVKEPRFVKIKI